MDLAPEVRGWGRIRSNGPAPEHRRVSPMLTSDASAVINSAAWHPAFTVTAEPFEHRHEGTILVHFSVDARNSDREHAPRYRAAVPGGARSAWPVYVGDLDDPGDLVARVVDAQIATMAHELREFARLPGAWNAPVHPHVREGIDRWARLHGTDPGADYLFGTA
jgi:hypothetical protein